MKLYWVEQTNTSGGYVYHATLRGDRQSGCLQKVLTDYPWGFVTKRQASDKYATYATFGGDAHHSVGTYYHKSKAKDAVVAAALEEELNRS